jgi:chromosome transmission fidelity protein 4
MVKLHYAHLSIAHHSSDIVSYLKEDWKKDATFSDSDSTGVGLPYYRSAERSHHTLQAVTALCVSSNGQYLAVATESKQILIYSTTISKVLFRQTPDHIPCCISFSPSENLLAWTCMDGTLVRLTNPITSDFPDPNQKVSERKAVSTTSAKRDYDPFGDDDTVPAEYDDDWVIDDLGDGLRDEPARETGGHYAKEMGGFAVSYWRSNLTPSPQ